MAKTPIIDAHNHLCARPDMALTAEMLIDEMDRLGIDRAIVFQENANMTFRTPDYNPYIGHDYIGSVQAKYADRLIGFFTMNPWHQSTAVLGWKQGRCELVQRNYALEELDRGIKELKLQGVKFHPGVHFYAFNDAYSESKGSVDEAPRIVGAVMDRIMELQQEVGRRIPVLVHAATGGMVDHFHSPEVVADVARRYPDITFIMAHMGCPWHLAGAIRAARELPNILLETAATDVLSIRRAVHDVGSDRVVMGSDFPFLSSEAMLDAVRTAVPDAKDRAKVLGGNLATLFS
ncbi:MAG: amidohydrolase family protein [Firmicutes bacterium]|nr:amidohydrolase family protein [Bacillota bacterium]